MPSPDRELSSIRLIRPVHPTYVCSIAERTLDYALRSGRTILVEDSLLLKTYGFKPLAVGVERKEVEKGIIEPGKWYRLINPRGLAGHLQDQFAHGVRRVDLEDGVTDWEEIRKLKLWHLGCRGINTRSSYLRRVDQTVAKIKDQHPVTVVDLSLLRGGGWQSNTP